jgi:hypothetical protein
MPTRAVALSSSLRAAFAIVLAFGLLAPTPAFAAKGNVPRVEVSASPRIDVVSPGQDLAFLASFANNGPGAITHLRFEGSAPGADFVRATAPCVGDGEHVACELGKFKAGTSVDLTIVFLAPAGGEVELSGSFAGDARSGNPNSASADVWPVEAAPITVNASSGFFGTWQESHDGLRTFEPIASGGQQSTVTAHAVANDYAVNLNHADALIECAPNELGDGFGQLLELSVADGGTAVDLKIEYAPGAVYQDAEDVTLVHELDDGTCVLVPRCDDGFDGNCFIAFFKGPYYDEHLVIKAQLPQNGRVKGF